MNLLVTGGCGFIGSNFIRQLLGAKGPPLQALVNLDQLTYAGNPANLTGLTDDRRYRFVQGDIADEGLLSKLLAEGKMDAVIHFAAETHVDRSIDSPEPFIQTNVVGTLRLLETVRRYWSQLAGAKRQAFRFLHVSTDEVYGDIAGGAPATEQSPHRPNSPYAASKAASNHLVRAYRQTYALPTLTTLCSNNYGPYQFPEKLIPLMILNALEGKPLPVYGDGLQVRDWLHVEDHVAAIWLILQNGEAGGTYHIGAGNERTNLDVVRQICSLLDGKCPRPDGQSYHAQMGFVADRPGHDRRYALDFGKLHRDLGWSPQISFQAGLARTIDWYLTHRAWCDEITAKRYARSRLGQLIHTP